LKNPKKEKEDLLEVSGKAVRVLIYVPSYIKKKDLEMFSIEQKPFYNKISEERRRRNRNRIVI
jgi:hypothetical protein